MPILAGRGRRAAAWSILALALIGMLPCIGLLMAPRILLVGCSLIREDGSCLPDPAGPLRIWIDAPVAARLSLTAGPRRVGATEHKVQSGRLLELKVPAGASFLTLHVREGWRWRWRLIRLTQRHEPDWLQEAWALRDKNQVESGRQLLMQHFNDAVSDEVRARMLSLRARIGMEQLRPDVEALLRESIAASARAGLRSDSLDDRLWLSNHLLQTFRLRETEALIREAESHFKASADLAPWWDYKLAQLAFLHGDFRRVLQHLEAGRELALATRNLDVLADIDQLATTVLALLGRMKDARRLVQEMSHQELLPCRKLDLLKAIGWMHLRAAEAAPVGPSRELHDARVAFEAARELIDPSGDTTRKCTQPRFAAQVLLQLARVAVQEGSHAQIHEYVASARQQLGAAGQPASGIEDVELALEALALEADAALAAGDLATAKQRCELLLQRGGATALNDTAWRTRVCLAQVAEGEGRLNDALDLYQDAEHHLELQGRDVPLGAGLGGFLGRHSSGTALYIDLLSRTHGEGEPGPDQASLQRALQVMRHARARSLLGFLAMDRLGRLPPELHQQYSAAIEDYHKLRSELDVLLVRRNRGALDTAQRDEAELQQVSRRSIEKIESALRILATGSATDAGSLSFRPVAPDEALLACHPVKKGWLCLLATAGAIKAHRLGTLDIGAPRRALAAALIEPFREELDPARIRRLKVVSYGALREIDVHLLPFGPDGAPLWQTVPVVYALDLPIQALREPAARSGEDSLPRRAFLLFDSEGRLPRSLASAEPILSALQKAHVAVEPFAQGVAWQGSWEGQRPAKRLARAELLQRIAGAGLFHDATHFDFSASDGLRSSIRLSDADGLSIGDVLTLPPAPRYVTLFGCETARSSEELGDLEGLGLAQAFLLRGAPWSIGTVREVGDELAARLATRFYAEFAERPDPLRALRIAVQHAGVPIADRHGSITPQTDLGAFRVYVP